MIPFRWCLLPLLLVGCAPLEFDPVLGYAGDRDGDGWLDYEEDNAGTNSLDRFDWDFGSGRWPDFTDEALADGVFATGWDVGETVGDFLSMDQYGNAVPFYTFYGYVVVLEFVSGHCDACNDNAKRSQGLWVDHRLDGVLIVHQVVDDDDLAAGVSPKFPGDWGARNALDHPVMHDDGMSAYAGFDAVRRQVQPEYAGLIPLTVVIDDQFRVVQSFQYDGSVEDAVDLAAQLARQRPD